MDIEEKMDLVMRSPTQEIVTKTELRELLERKEHPVTYCGYETSGPVHIGVFLSILKQIHLQRAGFKVKVLWPDLHTFLNRKGSMEWIHRMQEYFKECFIACGLDSGKTKFVQGSDFELDRDYIEDLLKLSLEVTISRARRSMTMIGRAMEDARVSQILYPLMQAVDIPYLGVDLAHGGIEQRRIHMIAREHLPRIGYDKPTCVHHSLLMALTGPGDKMSSSKPETLVAIHDPPQVIKERIENAFCPAKRIEDNPIIEACRLVIFSVLGEFRVSRPEKYGGDLTFYSFNELSESFRKGQLHPLDLKRSAAEAIIKIFQPVRKYFEKKPKALDVLELPRDLRKD